MHQACQQVRILEPLSCITDSLCLSVRNALKVKVENVRQHEEWQVTCNAGSRRFQKLIYRFASKRQDSNLLLIFVT